jgi:hypothetical protein
MTLAAAVAMATVIIEAENLSRMMISFCLAACYRNEITIKPMAEPTRPTRNGCAAAIRGAYSIPVEVHHRSGPSRGGAGK